MLANSTHHTLFLSGLYGLLRPTEPIQLYSCPLEPRISELWREELLLTEILLEYIDHFQIGRIIDLTAIDVYRQMIDWERIAETRTDILHCFHVMAAGESALTWFGMLLGELLDSSEDDLAGIGSDTRMGDVIFSSFGETESILPPGKHSLPYPGKSVGPEYQSSEIDADQQWRFASTAQFRRDVRARMNQFTKIMQAAMDVCRDPTSPRGDNVKPWKGESQSWRYRLDEHLRIVYRLDKGERVAHFKRVFHRGDPAYRKFRC